MNYQETLSYLFEKLPMYHRIGAAAYKADLHNTLALCNLLGNPEKKLKTIHVGGTNGKGSTSHLLASILQESGYKTGLYTSPHYKDFRERIRINGEKIGEDVVIDFIGKWKHEFDRIGLSFFEMTVGMAFDYFVRENVDFAVIEVGLGGRLDSTNVITPLVSVITNIGMDHTRFLGDSLEQIAAEKAGIIKPGIPVIIGESHALTAPVFLEVSNRNNSPITFADQNWHIQQKSVKEGFEVINIHHQNQPLFQDFEFPLKGTFQHKNLKTVLQTLNELRHQKIEIQGISIRNGIRKVIQNTGLMGRWQIIGNNPLVICDSGHNEPAVKEIVDNLSAISYKTLRVVFGMVNDKDHDKVLKLLPKKAQYYFCKANIPRGLPADVLAEKASEAGIFGAVFNTVEEAFRSAQSESDKNDLIFVGGSIFIVAEVLQTIDC